MLGFIVLEQAVVAISGAGVSNTTFNATKFQSAVAMSTGVPFSSVVINSVTNVYNESTGGTTRRRRQLTASVVGVAVSFTVSAAPSMVRTASARHSACGLGGAIFLRFSQSLWAVALAWWLLL